MNKISLFDSKKFSKLSGDKNLIHLSKKISKDFFFKEPVVHGVNLSIIALKKYIKKYSKNKFLNIDELKIIFHNYCLHDENFDILLSKNKINIKSKISQKTNIFIKSVKKKNKNKSLMLNKFERKIISNYNTTTFIKNLDLIKNLILISRKIGNLRPKNTSLIHKIYIKNNNKIFKSKFLIKKITNNIFLLKFFYKTFYSETIFSKIKKYNLNFKKFVLKKNIVKKIQNKKIIIFGSSSNLAEGLKVFLKNSKLPFLSYSLSKVNLNIKDQSTKLKKYLIKHKPDYIFYFSSPKITIETKKNVNSLKKNYNEVFYKNFKFIINEVLKNKLHTLVFYPSSYFLNEKEKHLNFRNYIESKIKVEKLSLRKKYQNIVRIYRLPKFKTRSTYNLHGYYEGVNLYNLKKYLENFFR